eukprot:524748-Pleurochrysis_carterae.AAC.1
MVPRPVGRVLYRTRCGVTAGSKKAARVTAVGEREIVSALSSQPSHVRTYIHNRAHTHTPKVTEAGGTDTGGRQRPIDMG